MYLELQERLRNRLRSVLEDNYGLKNENIPLEIPPDLQFGELATTIAFELARKLRKAPKIIAQEIVAALGSLEGFASFEVAGAGYINAFLNRPHLVRRLAAGQRTRWRPNAGESVNVEHTSINPNKAAHIGHLRNAILGDTLARILREHGFQVVVQNYIDNTGVQVADVVVGFLYLEGRSIAEIRSLIDECESRTASKKDKTGAFDYYCWQLYAKTSQWYEQGNEEENAARKKLRLATLHEIEQGGNETAELAELISTAVLRRHLETMVRLRIEYDFLPRESEILHLKFWEAARELMIQKGVLYPEKIGKNAGCWVMKRPGTETVDDGPDEDAKIIVRSNNTVTYVGKDIAFHLWKFRLLCDCEFGDEVFHTYTDGKLCYRSIDNRRVDDGGVPFGTGIPVHFKASGAERVYNVIDARQAEAQASVREALRGMGYIKQADNLIHFSYEMVALTPSYAQELGYDVPAADLVRPYIEISGRKGFGVKADDLMNLMVLAANGEILKRHPDWDAAYRNGVAEQIAYGALRYFMLKFTRNSVIAFDQKDALAAEGETGVYIQYAVVRARNIFRKAGVEWDVALTRFLEGIDHTDVAHYLAGESAADIWALWLGVSRSTQNLSVAVGTGEPAYLARHALQLAQEFNNFYHKHHILTEEDPARKIFLLATAAVALRELVEVLSWLGIESPEAM